MDDHEILPWRNVIQSDCSVSCDRSCQVTQNLRHFLSFGGNQVNVRSWRNGSTFLNQYPNWSNFKELRGVPFPGLLETLNGVNSGPVENASFNSAGRPVLFAREQTTSDCFYYSTDGNGPAFGSGCLRPREHSGEILP